MVLLLLAEDRSITADNVDGVDDLVDAEAVLVDETASIVADELTIESSESTPIDAPCVLLFLLVPSSSSIRC